MDEPRHYVQINIENTGKNLMTVLIAGNDEYVMPHEVGSAEMLPVRVAHGDTITLMFDESNSDDI